ncbi:hypothetical protein Nepgr_006903 [Nepenthes gracilis]|uniref:Cation/H+ exchanger domain-containing protein n=1 Tax=Nepenthes gracilis TaxID=150966 RepID=A0AAD3S5Z2_NEPGR|nr:hypothetical protein Nepgr_006903 [Nepenthes gracilis]
MAGHDAFSMRVVDSRNWSIYCHELSPNWSSGFFHHNNPLHYNVPLLLMQLSLIFVTSRLVEFCLKPLGQSAIVGQILGGMLLGPSLLSRNQAVASTLFPKRGSMILETFATFGLVLFSFEMGLKMDSNLMIRPKRMAMTIGGSMFFISTSVPLAVCFILREKVSMDSSLSQSLPLLAVTQSLTAFQVIACLLTELKILNTDVGRLAVASSMFCDLIGISVMAFGFSVSRAVGRSIVTFTGSILSTIALLVVIVFAIRPAILRFLQATSAANSLNELHMAAVFLSILISAFASEIVGQHYALGPLILGLALPDGPPLGAAISQKLDTLVTGLMYPTFLTVSGLKMNIFAVSFQALWVIGLIVLSGTILKLGTVILPAIYGKIPVQDAFVLGLVLNAKGITELIIYNLWRYDGKLTDQEFTASVISVLVLSAITTPLIRFLYDPPNLYVPIKRMTVQHNKRGTELRIAVCIHNQDNVPTIINLLEASTVSQESPVSVIGVILVELIGRTVPMFTACQPHNQTLQPSSSSSNPIINAFNHYGRQNEGTATVDLFTNMSHYDSMHVEVCQIALEKRANILIVPFHRKWAVDGTVETGSEAIRAMNQRLIDKAPCSLAVLIDRAPVTGCLTILNSRIVYQVAVLFIGGTDDAEALAYGARMSGHERVAVTVIRFLLLGDDNSRERKHDTDLVHDYRHANIGNERFAYREEVVRDGAELAEAIKCMERCFDLILVGRNRPKTDLLFGLDNWSECPELGVVGDMLAAADTRSTASVLVVQQQRLAGNPVPMLNDPNQSTHDVGPDGRGSSARRSFVAISMERDGRS